MMCAHAGSSVVTGDVPCSRDADDGEGSACVGQRVHRKSLYQPFRFAVDLKLL